jgi:D-lactate dehydrogenase
MKDIPLDSIVLSDSMSCSYHIMKKEQFHTIHTLSFIDSILPFLELKQIPGTAIIHPSCSVLVNDDLDLITRISKACSEKVIIPENTGCCGFAGDHGFYHPEITIQALLETKKEISTIAEVNGYYSVNATCEIGMNLGTEKPYESLLYLIAQAAGISV